jgi:Flp pilus assembly protein TadD
MRHARVIVGLMAAALLSFSPPAFSEQTTVLDKQICDVRADAALGLEDYTTAIKLHLHILHLHPNDALAHYHLGFAYGMAGRDPEEIDEYRKAVALGLDNWDLYLNLELAYAERKELSNATTALEQAALLAPGRPETHFNLALVYERENRLREARREVTISRRLDPADPDIENSYAIVCAEMGDRVSAQRVWSQLARMAPEYYPARTNLAILGRTGYAPPASVQGNEHPSPLILATPVGATNKTGWRNSPELFPLRRDGIYSTVK